MREYRHKDAKKFSMSFLYIFLLYMGLHLPCLKMKLLFEWHDPDYGMPGMPEIFLGMNYLLLEPRLLAAWVRRSRNLKSVSYTHLTLPTSDLV